MGLPTISYCNFLAETGVTVTARTQNSTYPASNILKPNVTHLYRSNSKSAVLNGAKYFWVGDDPWNSITGNFHFEILAKPSLADTGGAPAYIINKWGVAGQKAFAWRQVNANLQVLLSSNGTDTAATIIFTGVIEAWIHKRFDLNYNSTTQSVALYVNGIESGRVTVTTATGTASITGTVPASLFNGTTRLTIGSDHLGTDSWTGRLGLVGLRWASQDNGAWVQPSECIAYYSFDNSDGSDSSGNGRDLTPVNMAAGDYENYTGYQWIGFGLSAGQNPTCLFIDRRHNLSTGATVRVLEQSWFSTYSSLAYKSSVTAGQPIFLTFSGSGSVYRWLEIHDPNNADGYIEIPHVWLGQWQNLAGAFGDEGGYIRRAVVAGRGATSTIFTRVGSRIGPVLYEFELPWKFKNADRAIWEAAMAYAATDPMVLVLDRDNPDNAAYLVDWLGVHLGSQQGRGELVLRKRTDGGDDSLSETTMTFSECGAGVDQ